MTPSLTNADLVFDIETDGIAATKVHFATVSAAGSRTLVGYLSDEALAVVETMEPKPFAVIRPLAELPAALLGARRVIGHNILGYDLPTLKRLMGLEIPLINSDGSHRVWDTQLVAKIRHPDTSDIDFALLKKGVLEGKDLLKPHSLKTWGKRLGIKKIDFLGESNEGMTADEKKAAEAARFLVVTPEMLTYGAQDVRVNDEIYALQLRWGIDGTRSFALEHEFMENMISLEERGFDFNVAEAERLLAILKAEHSAIGAKLTAAIPPRLEQLKTKVKEHPFNPASRKQIGEFLISKGWVPKVFTESGQPKIDETVLDGLSFPEAADFSRYFLLEKRLGQLSDGKNGWLKLVGPDGRMHGHVNTIGTVTGRCSHSRPNMAQVPKAGRDKAGAALTPFGPEFRGLFRAAPGFKIVGTDAAGLQLRLLAHYMGAFDGGAYAKIVLSGDVHSANQQAAGLPTRDAAKTFIYAWLFGAGDEKIGAIVGGGKAAGAALKAKFLQALPALACLKAAIKEALKNRGHLVGLDGRPLLVRSEHAALNTLLMAAEAVVMKEATCIFRRKLEASGMVRGKDWGFVAHVHDEWQAEVAEAHAETAARVGCEAVTAAGESYRLRIRLDGDSKIGATWAETH